MEGPGRLAAQWYGRGGGLQRKLWRRYYGTWTSRNFLPSSGNAGPDSALISGSICDHGGTKQKEEGAMWIPLFTFASAAAVCLSIAAIMMQSAGQRPLRR